jgi:hypothetical protein
LETHLNNLNNEKIFKFCLLIFPAASATTNDSTIYYSLPDSIKAVCLWQIFPGQKYQKCEVGIKTDAKHSF